MVKAAALATAIARLQAFRSTFDADDIVDGKSGLTAADLTVIIDHDAQMVPIQYLDFGNPEHVANLARSATEARAEKAAGEQP